MSTLASQNFYSGFIGALIMKCFARFKRHFIGLNSFRKRPDPTDNVKRTISLFSRKDSGKKSIFSLSKTMQGSRDAKTKSIITTFERVSRC